MRFTKVTMVVLSALVVLGVASAPASAQRFADSSGTTLANGTSVVAGPSTLVMTTTMGTISCALRVQGTVASASTLNPISASVTTCTDSIPTFDFCSASASLGPATALSAFASGGTVALGTLSITFTYCHNLGACTYAGSITATLNNSANTLGFSQSVPRISGAPFCVSSATWTTTLTPVWADADSDGIKDAGESTVRILS